MSKKMTKYGYSFKAKIKSSFSNFYHTRLLGWLEMQKENTQMFLEVIHNGVKSLSYTCVSQKMKVLWKYLVETKDIWKYESFKYLLISIVADDGQFKKNLSFSNEG